MTATIRHATPDDWDAVVGLLQRVSLPLDGAREHITDFVLAERDGALVGCAAVERYADAGLLRSVAVAPTDQGHGTGASLVQRTLQAAAASGLKTVVLLTTTAERYFPSFGFAVTTRDQVPDSVRDTVEFRSACPASAVVMVRPLAADATPSC